MDLAFTVDLVTQRFVYPNDLGIGLRQLQLTKGVTYDISFSFVSGLSGASITPSGLALNICVPNQQNTPLISLSNISGSAFSVFVASPVLDYAINGQDSLLAECDVSFSGNGQLYSLASLATVIANNPSLSPQNEYYPLYGNPSDFSTSGDLSTATGQFYPASNPSGFITGVNLSPYASLAALNATGNALNAQILALDLESGTFYLNSNPSGFTTATALGATGQLLQGEIGALQTATGSYQTLTGIKSFTYALPAGANSYFIPFSPAFQSTPTVTYSLDIPPTGYAYTVLTSGVTPSGFGVYLSSTIGASGYALSVIARD